MLDEYDFSFTVRGKYFHRHPKNYQTRLQGIQFFTNDEGRKTGALIDFKEHIKIWTQILEKYENLTSTQRRK
jgi:hypothetical protein